MSMDSDIGRNRRVVTWPAVVAIAAMLAWFAVTNHVDLFPLNDLELAGDQTTSTLSGAVPFGLAMVTVLVFPRWYVAAFWAVYSYVWLALQLQTWWVPYLFGGARDHWARYQRTIHVLPEIGGRMGPDLQHLVLEALSLIAAVTLTRLALTRLRASQAGVLDEDTSREVGA